MARLLVIAAILSTLCVPSPALPPTCRDVAQMITPCVAYLADRAWAPYGPCCNGIAALKQAAQSLEDRVAVCSCLKGIAPHLPMVDLTRAAVLPRTCGVNLSVAVSPAIDCTSLASP